MIQHLQMKYHPAKKEVGFTLFSSSGAEVAIRSDQKLTKYMNQRGKFVLQDHGNAFFDDIAEAFDGEQQLHIDMITTKSDYEDFEQMVEYYNEDPNKRIEITTNLFAELPNMEKAYCTVRYFGQQAISSLIKHRESFFSVPQNHPDVKESVARFSDKVQEEIDNIRKKIDSMSDNRINLCFTGIFSSGKSTLINAILGHRILPENIKPETARYFRIQSPAKDEKIRVIFQLYRDFCEISWIEDEGRLCFSAGPVENEIKKSIQNTLNEHSGERQDCQLLALLKMLNDTDEIGTDIKVFFPVPLDTANVQFTIYDTPGTDSNCEEHKRVLQDALLQQTHSILIFVAAPDRIEGEGNNALLEYIKKAEEKDNKTSIDLARSLFVINRADTAKLAEQKERQTAIITDTTDPAFSIKLADKKLFFVSASYAFSARAVKNGIGSEEDKIIIEDDYNKLSRPERGRYYQSNRVATSELATRRQFERSEKKLNDALSNHDNASVIEICSGICALEDEIITYGEKYASSVRAFAIIDSVEKALATLNKNASSLMQSNQEDIKKIDSKIEQLGTAIKNGIAEQRKKHILPNDQPLPDELQKALHFDPESIRSNLTEKACSIIEKLLQKWFFGILGKVKIQKKNRDKIVEEITMVFKDYTRDFCSARKEQLESLRDALTDEIKQVIQANGEISQEAKDFILDVRPLEIKEFGSASELEAIIDKHVHPDNFLWIDTSYVDKKGLLQDVETKVTQKANEMADEYRTAFLEEWKDIADQIEMNFIQNLNTYSVSIHAMRADRDDMEQLRERIEAAANDLKESQQRLNDEIWREVKEDAE